jgi:hypothetical protein
MSRDDDDPPTTKPDNPRARPRVLGVELPVEPEVRERHPSAVRPSPVPAPKRSLSPAPQSSPTRDARSSWALHRDAFVGPVAKAAGAALALVLVAGATVLVTQLEGCSTSPAAIAGMQRQLAEQAKTLAAVNAELTVLREATAGASGRARNVASVQRRQAEWLCAQLRMFHRIGCVVEGDPKEPPMLNLGPSPLGIAEAFVIRPPTMIIATPVPAGDKD